jgi:hypothetical protein
MTSAHEQYKKDGFYVAKSLLDPTKTAKTLESLNKSIVAQIHECPGREPSNDICRNLKILFDSDLVRYKKLAGALWRKESVYALMHDQSITGFLRN